MSGILIKYVNKYLFTNSLSFGSSDILLSHDLSREKNSSQISHDNWACNYVLS